LAANNHHQIGLLHISDGNPKSPRTRPSGIARGRRRLANSGEQLSILLVPITARAIFCIK